MSLGGIWAKLANFPAAGGAFLRPLATQEAVALASTRPGPYLQQPLGPSTESSSGSSVRGNLTATYW